MISLQGGRQAAGRTGRDLRDHGWFVFFAPRDNPKSPASSFGEHGEHGSTSRADREAHHGDLFREEGRPAAADSSATCMAARPAPDYSGSRYARRRPEPRPRGDRLELRCSSDACYHHLDWLLLGGDRVPVHHRRRDDLQHDRQLAAADDPDVRDRPRRGRRSPSAWRSTIAR